MDTTPQTLPASVHRVEVEGKEIFLVGTAHVSSQSVADVRETIATVEPDTVCIELCASRFTNLTQQESWRKLNIFKVIRDGKAMLLLSSLVMTSFQRQIARQLGVTPGAEMLEAIHQAEDLGAELALVDRDIQITLKRTWATLGLWGRLKMASQLVTGLLVPQKLDAATIEEIKEESQLTDLLDTLARQLPGVKKTLIDERDVYLAQEIRRAPGESIVAVIGAGHVPGVLREIHRDTSLAPLCELPAPSLWPRLLKWAIPLAVVTILVYGFITGGTEQSMESIYLWVLINGALSAVGAAVAVGHPLTVVAAFLAAPLTSLNPMIAAGWVAGLVQAWIKKPTVEDLEDLPDALMTVRGFWFNPVVRILLVVSLSNLGSMLGTFIAGGWIAARTI